MVSALSIMQQLPQTEPLKNMSGKQAVHQKEHKRSFQTPDAQTHNRKRCFSTRVFRSGLVRSSWHSSSKYEKLNNTKKQPSR